MWRTLFYYLNQWRFTSGGAGERQEDSGDMKEKGIFAVSLEHPPKNIRLVEGADGQLMLSMEQVS